MKKEENSAGEICRLISYWKSSNSLWEADH